MLRTLKNADAESLDSIAEEKRIRRTDEVFLLFSMGSQFDHLIAQHLENMGVFCLVADPASVKAEDIKKVSPKGIIVSGGPASVYSNPLPFDTGIFDLGIPLLGICLGFQMWCYHIGCDVWSTGKREFGTHDLTLDTATREQELFAGCPATMHVLESHGDRITKTCLEEFILLGSTDNAHVAAARFKHLWGVQFHPECTETKYGRQIFENFVFKICGAKYRFEGLDVAEQKVTELGDTIGDGRVVLALSGGADSNTVAALLEKAMCGDLSNLLAVYIKGIDRADDEEHVIKHYSNRDFDLKIVDATDRFLEALAGLTDMHQKRVAVRKVYKEVLEEEIAEFDANFIAQGTLYTDISESGQGYDSGAKKAMIKLHHNVELGFSVPEVLPLADKVKPDGRAIGKSLKVPEELLMRHPFPGPGQVVRIMGEVTADKLRISRLLDKIYIQELRQFGLYDSVWQAGAALTDNKVTCTKGDDASQGSVVLLWAVWSVNGFTARWADMPNDFLRHVSQRITNEIREIGTVTYRISDKPPATIEVG